MPANLQNKNGISSRLFECFIKFYITFSSQGNYIKTETSSVL